MLQLTMKTRYWRRVQQARSLFTTARCGTDTPPTGRPSRGVQFKAHLSDGRLNRGATSRRACGLRRLNASEVWPSIFWIWSPTIAYEREHARPSNLYMGRVTAHPRSDVFCSVAASLASDSIRSASPRPVNREAES